MNSPPVPENANSGCVGPSSNNAGKVDGCKGCPNQSACASGATKSSISADDALINDRLAGVKHKILILSGKGGVGQRIIAYDLSAYPYTIAGNTMLGKSTFSAQLAFALAQKGYQVGLLDVDICGPSIPRMLGLEGHEVHQSASGWSPVYVEDNLGVMSIGFMLPSKDDAIIWRGPRKNGLIKQFLTDVTWNELDYLIVDTPPGTSDEHISIVQYLKPTNIDGAVVITTPQEVSMADVRKELNFCRKTGLNVLGVVENMADIRLPFSSLLQESSGVRIVDTNGQDRTQLFLESVREKCPELLDLCLQSQLFQPSLSSSSSSSPSISGPEAMAASFAVPFLGRLPMDPNMLASCERGEGFLETHPGSAAAAPFRSIVDKIVSATYIIQPKQEQEKGEGDAGGPMEEEAQ